MKKILGNILLILLISGCGSMKTTTEKDVVEKADISTVSAYTDSVKYAVQVLSMDMSKVLTTYPALQEKNVG